MGFTKIVFFGLVAFAGWYLYRKFVTDATKLARSSEAKRKEEKNGALGTLVQDPATGEYRVRRADDK